MANSLVVKINSNQIIKFTSIKNTSMNILTEKFNTPYHSAPFDQIKNEDYLPAFKALIQQSEEEINALINNC